MSIKKNKSYFLVKLIFTFLINVIEKLISSVIHKKINFKPEI